MIPLGEETAFQAIFGSIVCALRMFKKPREMIALGCALHSVRPQLSFFFISLRFGFSFRLPLFFFIYSQPNTSDIFSSTIFLSFSLRYLWFRDPFPVIIFQSRNFIRPFLVVSRPQLGCCPPQMLSVNSGAFPVFGSFRINGVHSPCYANF